MIKNLVQLRAAVLERDNFTCTQCGSKENLECHHIKPRCDYPELALDVDNCITLCHSCHIKTDSYKVYRHRTKTKSNTTVKKILRITDEQREKVEFLKKLFNCSENTVFIIALEKLYKDYK